MQVHKNVGENKIKFSRVPKPFDMPLHEVNKKKVKLTQWYKLYNFVAFTCNNKSYNPQVFCKLLPQIILKPQLNYPFLSQYLYLNTPF